MGAVGVVAMVAVGAVAMVAVSVVAMVDDSVEAMGAVLLEQWAPFVVGAISAIRLC